MKPDTLRAILAANLRRMIQAEADREGKSYSVRAWAIRRELDVRMIDRLTKGEHAITLDKLDEIASACGLSAWHLLIDGIDTDNPPEAPISQEDRVLLNRLRKLLDS